MNMYFEGYGELDWIEPEQYYAEAWTFYETAVGEDGEKYDIVLLKGYPCKLAYTTV